MVTQDYATSKKQPLSKTAHALGSPFSEFSWPLISQQLENTILGVLLPIISPVGEYRKKNSIKSKGKARSKRRKKIEGFKPQEKPTDNDTTQSISKPLPKPEAEPDVCQYCTIGFNSTVRCLEYLAQTRNSPGQPTQDDTQPAAVPFAVFVCTTSMPEIMKNPLPLLTATASLSLSGKETIRLIPVSAVGATRIADALNQPRVNVLSVSIGVPGMEELKTLLHNNLEHMGMPWISGATNQKYLPVKIHTSEIVVSQPKVKGEKRKRGEQSTSS